MSLLRTFRWYTWFLRFHIVRTLMMIGTWTIKWNFGSYQKINKENETSVGFDYSLSSPHVTPDVPKTRDATACYEHSRNQRYNVNVIHAFSIVFDEQVIHTFIRSLPIRLLDLNSGRLGLSLLFSKPWPLGSFVGISGLNVVKSAYFFGLLSYATEGDAFI